MARLFVDASVLIALGTLGALHVLRALDLPLATTQEVLDEVLRDDRPGAEAVRELRASGAIELVRPVAKHLPPRSYGLGRGESSLFAAARPNDVLVLDDLNARRVAEARSIAYVGTLGILIEAAQRGSVEPADAVDILERLARSDFRMTAELYAEAGRRLKNVRRSAGG